MLNWLDNLLNRITMYKLVVYTLIAFLLQAFILSVFHILPFNPLDLFFSTLILVVLCWLANDLISWLLKIPTNSESFLITALILALIITPPNVHTNNYWPGVWFLAWAAIWAMASKFILTWRGKHIFNPAAFAVALAAFTIGASASWWVGTLWMLPLVVIGGLLIVRKVQRFDMVLAFLAVAVVTIFTTSFSRSNPSLLLQKIFADTPIVFFATIMLTEPLTTPAKRLGRILYGAATGLIFAPSIHIGPIYSTPELSLLVVNLLAYVLEPKANFLLTFKHKQKIGTNTYEFLFQPKYPVAFQPGQYLEVTLPHDNPDFRGNRRYFTIASSPTEHEIRLGIKFYDQPSSFKHSLLQIHPGTKLLGGHPIGDFTLPRNKKQKLVFIAGGIGVTPFRSMLQYLIDKQEPRDIVLFYSNKTADEIAYHELFVRASEELGVKTFYTLADLDKLPPNWPGLSGFLTPQIIKGLLPDFHERMYYISGPRGLVVGFERTLKQMGIHRTQIRIDFFPGFV